jgi:hypothetical protein
VATLFSPEKCLRGGARAAMHWMIMSSSRNHVFPQKKAFLPSFATLIRDKFIFLDPACS